MTDDTTMTPLEARAYCKHVVAVAKRRPVPPAEYWESPEAMLPLPCPKRADLAERAIWARWTSIVGLILFVYVTFWWTIEEARTWEQKWSSLLDRATAIQLLQEAQ